MVKKIVQSFETCGDIHKAAFEGDVGCIKKLMDEGVDPNVRDVFGRTPLHLAVQAGHRGVVELLLNYGADPNARDAAGQTPLHWAVACGHADIEELLLERGADPNAKDFAGNTPLHIAAMTTYFSEVAEVMFEVGPKLFPAEFPYDRGDVVRMLLEYGADPTVENEQGLTPLDLAVKMDNDLVAEIIASRLPPEHTKSK